MDFAQDVRTNLIPPSSISSSKQSFDMHQFWDDYFFNETSQPNNNTLLNNSLGIGNVTIVSRSVSKTIIPTSIGIPLDVALRALVSVISVYMLFYVWKSNRGKSRNKSKSSGLFLAVFGTWSAGFVASVLYSVCVFYLKVKYMRPVYVVYDTWFEFTHSALTKCIFLIAVRRRFISLWNSITTDKLPRQVIFGLDIGFWTTLVVLYGIRTISNIIIHWCLMNSWFPGFYRGTDENVINTCSFVVENELALITDWMSLFYANVVDLVLACLLLHRIMQIPAINKAVNRDETHNVKRKSMILLGSWFFLVLVIIIVTAILIYHPDSSNATGDWMLQIVIRDLSFILITFEFILGYELMEVLEFLTKLGLGRIDLRSDVSSKDSGTGGGKSANSQGNSNLNSASVGRSTNAPSMSRSDIERGTEG